MVTINRRQFIVTTGSFLLGLAMPRLSWATAEQPRRLAFDHLHTGESLDIEYCRDGSYDASALSAINRLMRDFRTEDEHPIDPKLLDFLHTLKIRSGTKESFAIISGYRSPKTNAILRSKSGGVAKRSLHMQGRAVDVRLPDVPTDQLRHLAVQLRLGGVGYYQRSDFLHVDTGRVRAW
jgi:uncharacterized protein YcbK (DUF882 family)